MARKRGIPAALKKYMFHGGKTKMTQGLLGRSGNPTGGGLAGVTGSTTSASTGRESFRKRIENPEQRFKGLMQVKRAKSRRSKKSY